MIQGFEAKDFSDVWSLLRQIPASDQQKLWFYHLAVIRMSAQGGFAEAKAAIDESFGSGALKSALLMPLFERSGLSPAEVLEASRGYQYPDETRAVQNALMLMIQNSEFSDWQSLGALSDAEALAVMKGLVTRISEDARSNPDRASLQVKEAFDSIRQLQMTSSKGDAVEASFVRQVAAKMPFEAWEVFEAAKSSIPHDEVEGLTVSLSGSMARVDPERAASLQLDQQSNRGLEETVTVWLDQDKDRAAEWMSANWGRFSATQRDAVAMANVRFALANNEVDSASNWVSQIQDEQIREKALQLLPVGK